MICVMDAAGKMRGKAMRALVQRVSRAQVSVSGDVVGEIGPGVMVLVCAMQGDGEAEADKLAAKLSKLRIFKDDEGRMNRSLLDTGGAALVVSQFTLAADTSRGNRPGFSTAAAETVVTVNGVDIDSTVFDAYLESRFQKPAAQATADERATVEQELTDIYLLTTQPKAKEFSEDPKIKATIELRTTITSAPGSPRSPGGRAGGRPGCRARPRRRCCRGRSRSRGCRAGCRCPRAP